MDTGVLARVRNPTQNRHWPRKQATKDWSKDETSQLRLLPARFLYWLQRRGRPPRNSRELRDNLEAESFQLLQISWNIKTLIPGRIGNKVFSDRQIRYVQFSVLGSFFKRASTPSNECFDLSPNSPKMCCATRGGTFVKLYQPADQWPG
ncbi:hypothetical protein K0M31_010189 [Melipona bicolor]|uniref:Uncharacterized protein n=1 Tax=Melipona bicolor TaxID=60889 RepID=A0AA40KIB6_9HYME|nr:hypothetical protein K0M31_010189 [Melipona bicolor]